MSKLQTKARTPMAAPEVASLDPRAAARHPSDPRIVADTIRMIIEMPDASYRRSAVTMDADS